MRALVLSFLLALSAPASAQQPPAPAFPDFDSREQCERQNRALGLESAVVLRNCLELEDRNRARVQAIWEELPGAIRRTCLRQQQVLSMSSYLMLSGCIDQERAATRDLERRPR